MSASLPNRIDATPRQRIARPCVADVCLTPAKASLPQPVLLFECIEATASKFQLSDKEMSASLRVTQSNYSRRTYNVSRVQFLNLEMRRYFTKELAKAEGLQAEPPTEIEKVKAAAKQNMLTLLDLMEAL
jgi:hypothetical protein